MKYSVEDLILNFETVSVSLLLDLIIDKKKEKNPFLFVDKVFLSMVSMSFINEKQVDEMTQSKYHMMSFIMLVFFILVVGKLYKNAKFQ
jgi:hypothetical protein